MTGIAPLAVTFAILPMRAAIALALLTTWVLVLWRNPLPNPELGESIGSLSCFLGFLGGATLGAWVSQPDPDCGLPVIGYGLGYGLVGSIVAGIVGHLVALTLPEQRSFSPALVDGKQEKIRAEIESIEQLLMQAEEHGDKEVRLKLAEYKAKLA
jgi:hypothetical protein